MKIKLPRSLVIGCSIAFVLGIGAYLLLKQFPLLARLKDGRLVPPWGLKVNPNTMDKANPGEVEREFKKIYGAMVAFRKSKGRLPFALSELMATSPNDTYQPLTQEDLTPSDYVISDDYAAGMRDQFQYTPDFRGKRPDGSDKPAYPKPGERDAWVSTGIYKFENTVIYPNLTARSSPSGSFIVLWSDGTIERIPADRQLWIPVGNTLEASFPGQTGIPRSARTAASLQRFTSSAIPAGLTDTGPAPR